MYTYIIYKYVNLLYNTYHISVYIPYNIYNIYYMEYIYTYIPKYIPYTLFKSQPIVNQGLDVEFETIKVSKK